MPDDDLRDAANTLLELCKARKLTLATAESCTGGLVAATLSEIPGSSFVLDRGFVTYSNEAKQQMLGVAPATIDVYGAVSPNVPRRWQKARWRMPRSILRSQLPASQGRREQSPESPSGSFISAPHRAAGA